jgi:hypothetical protein
MTSAEQVARGLDQLAAAGATDLVSIRVRAEPEQIELLAEATRLSNQL